MAKQIVEPMEKQVKVDTSVGQAGLSAAFDNAALTPTMMGQLGATMALSASQEYNKMRGTESGMNPHGNTLPPITMADKAYVDAYQNQAQATLTNQAQQLFDKSQEEMGNLGKMTGGSIAEYQKNLHQGLSEILEQAPNDVKASLANQFTQQMESSTHRYTMQMQQQQKAAAFASSNAALSQITDQIHGASMDGNAELADRLYKDSVAMVNRGAASNMYTAAQAETLNNTARLTLLSSKEIKKGLDAKRQGKMDSYLSDLADETKKPSDVSWSDWESIRSNSAKYLNNVKSLESQHQQLTASNGSVEIAEHSMTAEKMEKLKGDLKESPLLFNNLAIQFANQQRKSQNAKVSSDFYAQNWQNLDAFREAAPKDINKAFSSLVELKKQQSQASGNPITQEEAEYQMAAASAVPVPAYNTKLNDYLTSGNPQLMMQGLQDFKRLNQFSGNKTIGVQSNPKAMAMMGTFEGFLKQGKDDQTAALMAEEVVSKKTPELVSMNTAQTEQKLRNYGSTPSKLNSWANRMAGVESGVHITNQAALTSTIVGMYKENMQWTNANEDVSIKMIEDGFHKAWGVSKINGRKEMTYLPPEKSIGLDDGAVPLMQLEIADQIKAQTLETKRAYDEGHSEFYITVKDRPDYDAFLNAQNSVRNKGLKDPDYATHKQVINEFKKGAPVELERIYRNGHKESFTANIQSNPYQGINPSTGELAGDYDIGLVNTKTGLAEQFIGIFGTTRITPVYRPNVSQIKSRYIAVNGLTPQDPIEKILNYRNQEAKYSKLDASYAQRTLNPLGQSIFGKDSSDE